MNSHPLPATFLKDSFRKITFDFSEPRICAHLRGPVTYRTLPCFRCLLVLLAPNPTLICAPIICGGSPAWVFASRSAINPFLRFLAKRLFMAHFLPFTHFWVPTRVLDSHSLPSTNARDNFRKNHLCFSDTSFFARICEAPVRIDPATVFDACEYFWHLLQPYFLRTLFVVTLLPGFSHHRGRYIPICIFCTALN